MHMELRSSTRCHAYGVRSHTPKVLATRQTCPRIIRGLPNSSSCYSPLLGVLHPLSARGASDAASVAQGTLTQRIARTFRVWLRYLPSIYKESLACPGPPASRQRALPWRRSFRGTGGFPLFPGRGNLAIPGAGEGVNRGQVPWERRSPDPHDRCWKYVSGQGDSGTTAMVSQHAVIAFPSFWTIIKATGCRQALFFDWRGGERELVIRTADSSKVLRS